MFRETRRKVQTPYDINNESTNHPTSNITSRHTASRNRPIRKLVFWMRILFPDPLKDLSVHIERSFQLVRRYAQSNDQSTKRDGI